jgi:3-deoxy-D-manno-octulosonic acid kinase
MQAPKLTLKLPPGYDVVQSTGALLAVHRAYGAGLLAAGFGPDTDGPMRESSLAGRKPLFEIATGADRYLVRRFSHGGLLRFLTGSRFRDPMRPFHELALAHELGRRGIATADVVAARARSLRGGGFALDLVTRQIPDTLDLGFVLSKAGQGEVRARDLRRLAVELGALVRRLHDAGFLHADLTLNNVLASADSLSGAAPKLWILDLDRARIEPALTDAERRKNLTRLYRFVARRDGRAGRPLRRSDFARFFRGYDPDRTRWKSDWRAISAAEGAARAVHSLGWGLEGVFGRSRDPRFAESREESRS